MDYGLTNNMTLDALGQRMPLQVNGFQGMSNELGNMQRAPYQIESGDVPGRFQQSQVQAGGQPVGQNQGQINGFGQNQYTQRLADQLTARSNQNLNQTVMPQISQGAQLAGQYGGTRQGVAQGVAAGNAQTGLDSAIAGLYVDAYGRDQNFYTQQRGQDQSAMQLGANIYNMGNTGNLGIGAGQAALGQQYQNAPMQATQTYSSTINPYMGVNGGTNSSHSSTTTNYDANGRPVGGGLEGALGAGLAGYQTIRNLGFGSGGGGSGNNYSGSSTNPSAANYTNSMDLGWAPI